MKTLCIKTNNLKTINYLLDNLQQLNLNNLYFSCHKFKVFTNIFIHYKGEDETSFISEISNILTFLILDNFEYHIMKRKLQKEHFYFDAVVREQILDKATNICIEDIKAFEAKEDILFDTFYSFLSCHKKLYLEGFITFRLKQYINELEKILDTAINQYLIEKEYDEFIYLLKLYINSEGSKTDLVHLIYHNEESILLDKHKNIIDTKINLTSAKYLSDISFSSCDMVLNTLLNIIPENIYIYLDGNEEVDEFINTLELIFEDRVKIYRDYDALSSTFTKK